MAALHVICLLLAVTSDAAKVQLLDTVSDQEVFYHPLWQSLGSSSQVKTQWHSDSGATFLSSARSSSQRVAAEVAGWQLVALVVGGIVAGIILDRMLGSLAGGSQKEEPPADEGTQTPQGDQGVDVSGAPADEPEKAAAPADDPEKAAEENPLKHIDYEKLLRLLSQRVMQQVGPKLAKADAVRTVLEERATTIKGKAKAFLLNELNYTAADLLKAIDAEEAMIFLDWNNMIASNCPPIAVLLAGLLSPTILSIRQIVHMIQILVGLLPILALCLWAVIADYRSICPAIPGMYLWVCVQCALALLLTLGHIMLYMKISSGKAQLAAKADEFREKLESFQKTSEENLSIEQMRELFICGSVLLQQALLVEDSARQSFWMTVTGAGSVLWLFTIIWNFVLVVGWTFVPGQVAFHPDAAEVAGNDYCGALVTVFVARVVFMLQMLLLFTHILTILNWVSDLLVTSPAYIKAIVGVAENIDAGMLGIPVAQTLFRAFLLRGGSEMATSQLRVALNSKNALEKEHAEAKRKAEDLAFRLQMANQEVGRLQTNAKGSETADLQACMDSTQMLATDLDPDQWQEKGAKAIEDMRVQAAAIEEATTRELDQVLEKLQELLLAIQNHESVKAIVAQAQQILEMAQVQARALADQATSENIQGMLAQAQQVAGGLDAQKILTQAQQAAGVLDAQKIQETLAQAQEFGAAAAAKAKEATANIDVEALQGAVAQVQEAGAAAAARAQEAATAAASSSASEPATQQR